MVVTMLDPAAIKMTPVRDKKSRKVPVRFTSNIVGPLYLAADLFCFFISVPVAILAYALVRGDRIATDVHLFAFALVLGSFFVIRSSRRSYERSIIDQEAGSVVVFDAVVSWLITSALVWQAGMIGDYSRGLTLSFVISAGTLLLLSRPLIKSLVKYLASKGQIQQRVALYGADPASVVAVKRLISSLKLEHLRIVGIVDDRSSDRTVACGQVIGGLERLREIARAGEVDQVLICGSNFGAQRLTDIVEQLSDVAIDVSVIPREAFDLSANYQVNLLGTWPVLTLWKRPLRDINQIVKRAEDLLIGALALFLCLPILSIAAILVRLSSRGPIFFVQPRLGFNNEIIEVYKFRTMYVEDSDVAGKITTSREDPRVTPVGRVLRKFSIDELPQLFNVIEGSMSLVGPRPHALEMKVGDRYYHEAVRGYAGRHRVKPGITGLAQVRGLRGEVRTIARAQKRVKLDQEYLDNWSLWLDFKIMFATVRAVLFDSDAY